MSVCIRLVMVATWFAVWRSLVGVHVHVGYRDGTGFTLAGGLGITLGIGAGTVGTLGEQ